MDGEEIDSLQLGDASSIKKLLKESARLRVDDISAFQIFDAGSFETRLFEQTSGGRIIVKGISDDEEGLFLVSPKSGELFELISFDNYELSPTYFPASDIFFVTVAEDNRVRCLSVDMEGNQSLVGRGYCKPLVTSEVLAIDEDDDSSDVSVLKADSSGEPIGKYDFQLEDFSVTSDGHLAYGYKSNDDGESFFAVFDFQEEEIWTEDESAIGVEAVETGSGVLLIATDNGDEQIVLESISSDGKSSTTTTLASAESLSVFSLDAGNTLLIGESKSGDEATTWQAVSAAGSEKPSDEAFFDQTLSSIFAIPTLGQLVGWDGEKGELFLGNPSDGLEYVEDIDADYINVFASGEDLFIHAGTDLWRLDPKEPELFRLANDVSEVVSLSEEDAVFVYTDTDDNQRLARYVDDEMVDLDEADIIYDASVSSDGFIYYSTSDYDGSGLVLKAIKMVGSANRQRTQVSEEVTDDVLLRGSIPTWNGLVHLESRWEFDAVIDERRRACNEEGLQIVGLSEIASLSSISGSGATLCLNVTEDDGAAYPYFGLEVLNDADFDLAMEISQDGSVLYSADDQVSGSSITSYSPLRDDLQLDPGTYRVRIFEVEGNSVSAPTNVRFFGSNEPSITSSAVAGASNYDTGDCDWVLESDDYSIDVYISNSYTTTVCISRLATGSSIAFETLNVYGGSYLDVELDCDDFSNTYYYTYDVEYQAGGKGYNRCYITETYGSDGYEGTIRISYGGDEGSDF